MTVSAQRAGRISSVFLFVLGLMDLVRVPRTHFLSTGLTTPLRIWIFQPTDQIN